MSEQESLADLLARVIGGTVDRLYLPPEQWTCECGLRAFVSCEEYLRHLLTDCPLRKRAS